MDLKQFIASHPQIAEYDESDSSLHQSVLKLISKPMKLMGLALAYERTPSFNALLKAQGLAFKTIVSKRAHLLTGLFSISSSPRHLNGQTVQAAYLGDFRIENDLKIAAFWRKNYGLVLNLLASDSDLNKPAIFLTAILKDNKLAQKTLVDNPRSHGEFKYHFLRSVEMINILSRPIVKARTKKNIYKVRFLKASDEEKLLDFMDQHEKEKVLGFDFKSNDLQLWQQRKQFFPQFDVTRFLVVEDETSQWIAVTLPASPDAIKRMTLQSLNWPVKAFFRALTFFGLKLPNESESVKTLYLTHLNIKKSASAQSVIATILEFLRTHEISKEYHMVSFANWWNDSWNQYLTYSATINLYEVTRATQKPRLTTIIDLPNQPIGFEMVLV